MPHYIQKFRNQLLHTQPSLADFEKAERLFKQHEHTALNKIKRTESMVAGAQSNQFSAIQHNGEIYLLSLGHSFNNVSEIRENRDALLKRLAGLHGITCVKFAFKKLPNGSIKPMMVKIIEHTPQAHETSRQRIENEMRANHRFGIAPDAFLMERDSQHFFSENDSIPTQKFYQFLDDCGPDLVDLLDPRQEYPLSPLATLDIAIQCFKIPYTLYEQGLVHRDLKLDNIASGVISREYNQAFYKIRPIDPDTVKKLASSKEAFIPEKNDARIEAGTAEYLTPYIRRFLSKSTWALAIIPMSVEPNDGIEAQLEKIPTFTSGYILQETKDSLALYSFRRSQSAGKGHYIKSFQLSPEKVSNFKEKYTKLFANGVLTFEPQREQLIQILSLTLNTLPHEFDSNKQYLLAYNLETDWYAIAITVLKILELDKSENTFVPRLSSKELKLFENIKFLTFKILRSSTFDSCNPYPRLDREKIKGLIDHLEETAQALKNEHRILNVVSNIIPLSPKRAVFSVKESSPFTVFANKRPKIKQKAEQEENITPEPTVSALNANCG
jgi:serine/threonine protein kinase